ncbi:MAG TPA: HlyD family secretion protein [Anaerolineae bacterium]|nr:HlyD family secretion protein [Anaerolineae bacterium]
MSSSFSRSMRTLKTENVGYVPWAMVGVALILGAWLWWALVAQLPIYASSVEGEMVDGEMMLISLPAANLADVAVGQPVQVRLDAFDWTVYGWVEGVVTAVSPTITNGQIEVELRLIEPPDSIPLQPGLTGSADIEVAQMSPAELLLTILR